MISKQYADYLKSDKWRRIAKQRLEIDHYTCQSCGCRGTPGNPVEIHHLSYKYLYHEENRVYQDLVSVCRICHKNLHHLMSRITDEQGSRGWSNNANIPQIHCYDLAGNIESEVKEDGY